MKKDNLIWIIVALIIALAIIVGAYIISNNNHSNNDISDTSIIECGDGVCNVNEAPTTCPEDCLNPTSIEEPEDSSEICKVEGTGCLNNIDCCGTMLCCRTQGYSSGYCAISCA